MSIKINIQNSLKCKSTIESSSDTKPEATSLLEQSKITTKEAQLKLSEFIKSIKSSAKDKLSHSESNRFDTNYKKGVEVYNDTEATASQMAELQERLRNPVAKSFEKGRAYLNAATEVGVKNGMEFVKNDIRKTKEDIGSIAQQGAEKYMAGQSFIRKDITRTKEDINGGLERSKDAIKWLNGKGKQAWSSLKSTKDNIVQAGKEKVNSTKKSLGEKLIQKGMEMKGFKADSDYE